MENAEWKKQEGHTKEFTSSDARDLFQPRL